MISLTVFAYGLAVRSRIVPSRSDEAITPAANPPAP
jgi:hypothetical protein